MSDAFLEAPDHFDLVYVGTNGTTTWGFGYQPTTDDIAARNVGARFCVQKIGHDYEVYDLHTLKKLPRGVVGGYTIGMPVFVNKDPDAAIMWALMNL